MWAPSILGKKPFYYSSLKFLLETIKIIFYPRTRIATGLMAPRYRILHTYRESMPELESVACIEI